MEMPMVGGQPQGGAPRRIGEDFLDEDSRVKITCGLGTVAAMVLALIISIGALEPVEYGLKYNKITKNVDGRHVYHGGLHVIGFWNEFVKFPSTVCNVEFSQYKLAQSPPLKLRTKEGLDMTLHISFQYHLTRNETMQLYALANTRYEPFIIRNARDVLLRSAADYNGTAWWLSRSAVGEEMLDLLRERLRPSHVEVVDLQLLIIELPDKYESSIVNTQVQKQLRKTRMMEQQATAIRADTEVKVAGLERDIKVLLQGGEAKKELSKRLAEAEASRKRIATEAQANEYVRKKLGLNSQQLVEYQRAGALLANANATLLVGMEGSNIVMNTGRNLQDRADADGL
jgi:regulator of protease activity HflC (stomatin/prohibitin superfamily)